MARYLIQSNESGQFIMPDPDFGGVIWSQSLRDAVAFGVLSDLDQVEQITQDHCDSGAFSVIDIDADFPLC
jgi:hypothetical protein